MNFETIVLRFRDLHIQKGETISRHLQLISKYNEVWWGWWNKSFEKVPAEEFGYIQRIIHNNQFIELFLLDSGQKLLYKTKCKQIIFENAGIEIPSPEPDKTPLYYNDSSHYCWFCFTEITLINYQDDFIKRYSYVRVDSLFDNNNSTYTVFYGKKICSLNEMIQHNRTAWFIRKSERNDGAKEIILLTDIINEPTDFSTKYSQNEGDTLLWLSDLHFDSTVRDKNHMAFDVEQHEARVTLDKAIQTIIDKEKIKIGGLVISGDFTWKSKKEEFDLAKNFLSNLISSFGNNLNPYNIIICPGNHDICFIPKTKINKQKKYEIKKASDDSKKAYEDFYEEIFYRKPNEYLCSGKKIMLENGQLIDIAALNSCWLEQIDDTFHGYGYINTDQLDLVTKKMGWDKIDNNAIRIVTLHHHYVPVSYALAPETDAMYSVLLNAEQFARWIEQNKVKVVLHGHMHQSFYTKISRLVNYNDATINIADTYNFEVLGIGSAGAKKNHLEEETKNVIGTIQFGNNDIKVNQYEISANGPYRKIKSYNILNN